MFIIPSRSRTTGASAQWILLHQLWLTGVNPAALVPLPSAQPQRGPKAPPRLHVTWTCFELERLWGPAALLTSFPLLAVEGSLPVLYSVWGVFRNTVPLRCLPQTLSFSASRFNGIFKLFGPKSVPELKSLLNGVHTARGSPCELGVWVVPLASVCTQLLFELENVELALLCVLKNYFFFSSPSQWF